MRKRGAKIKHGRSVSPWIALATAHDDLSKDQATDLGLAYWIAFKKVTSGQGVEQDLHTLAASVNIAVVLCERGIGAEFLEAIKRGQDAVIEAMERFAKHRKVGMSGPAQGALREALEIHDAQIEQTKVGDMRVAIAVIMARISNGDVVRVEA
jgi:hypothetical protein